MMMMMMMMISAIFCLKINVAFFCDRKSSRFNALVYFILILRSTNVHNNDNNEEMILPMGRLKMQDWKKTDDIAWLKNYGPYTMVVKTLHYVLC